MTQPDDRRCRRDPVPPAALLVVLSAGPKSSSEIEDSLLSFGRRPPGDPWPRPGRRRSRADADERLAATLEHAVAGGWVVESDGWFRLTDIGKAEALDLLDGARNRREQVHHLLEPRTVARAAMIAQIGITALKVPAALASRSAVQVNDAAEELLDVLSSGGVYLGVRFGRERAANIVVVGLMLATACLALFVRVEAVLRHGDADRDLVPSRRRARLRPLLLRAVGL